MIPRNPARTRSGTRSGAHAGARMLAKLAIALAAATLAACGTQVRLPEADANVAAFQRAEKTEKVDYVDREALAAFERAAAEPLYRVGEGDKLTVSVWGRPEVSGKHTVGPDGRLAIPLAGTGAGCRSGGVACQRHPATGHLPVFDTLRRVKGDAWVGASGESASPDLSRHRSAAGGRRAL